MGAPAVGRLLERELRVFAKLWHAFAFSTFVLPALFLAAMGVGLGGLVDESSGDVGGLSYLDFVAPGLLVASAVQQAAGESLWPVLGGVKWDRRFDAMIATPVTTFDVYLGLQGFIALRVVFSASAFLLVASLLGGLVSWWSLVAVPTTVLCAVAFSAPLAAYAITRENDVPFAMIMRLGVLPLFLLSGTFFPVENLPDWAEPLAWLSPLWHGVELARDATTGQWQGVDVAHVAVLLAIVAAGTWWGRRTFARRLAP